MQTAASKLLPALLFLALCILALATLAMPKVIPGVHSAKHPEAESIRCSNDIVAVFTNSTCERHNVLKRLDDGRVGDQVVHPCKRGLLEITLYIIGDGTLEEAIAELTAKGCVQTWP